jgi:hypothetical protein
MDIWSISTLGTGSAFKDEEKKKKKRSKISEL